MRYPTYPVLRPKASKNNILLTLCHNIPNNKNDKQTQKHEDSTLKVENIN